DRVASLRFAVPRVDFAHADASDHFDSGHGLNFADAAIDELAALEQVASLEDHAQAAGQAYDEACARGELLENADSDAGAAGEQKALERWVAEAVKHLARAWDIRLAETAPAHLRERAGDALESCRHTVQDAYQLAGVRPPSEVIHLLTGSSTDDTGSDS